MKLSHKKEMLKFYGESAEVFEESLVPFLPKILTYLQRKLKDGDPNLHGVISESIGLLVHNVMKKLNTLEELLREMNPVLKMIFTNLQVPTKNL